MMGQSAVTLKGGAGCPLLAGSGHPCKARDEALKALVESGLMSGFDRGCVETEILRNWSRCVCDAATELGLDRGKWNAISLLSAFIPLSSPL